MSGFFARFKPASKGYPLLTLRKKVTIMTLRTLSQSGLPTGVTLTTCTAHSRVLVGHVHPGTVVGRVYPG